MMIERRVAGKGVKKAIVDPIASDGLTWGEFKRILEKKGVHNGTQLKYIDVVLHRKEIGVHITVYPSPTDPMLIIIEDDWKKIQGRMDAHQLQLCMKKGGIKKPLLKRRRNNEQKTTRGTEVDQECVHHKAYLGSNKPNCEERKQFLRRRSVSLVGTKSRRV